MTITIDRGFVRTSTGLIHYRAAGADTSQRPIILLHGGPGSSAGLVPLIAALATRRRVIAPDTAGCGDSEPLAHGEPTIPRYAAVVTEVLDRLRVTSVDVYGHHTGAQLAAELAIAAPLRIGRLVLDGVGLFPPALRCEFLARYAPPLVPLPDGSHVLWAWEFARRLTQNFPHYSDSEDSRIEPATVVSLAQTTTIAAEVLKAWPTWHLVYHAAFRHDLAARLPFVLAATLVLRVRGDPLSRYADEAVGLMPLGALRDVCREDRPQVIDLFFRS